MTRAIVALGSNLGDRARYLQDAVDGLPGLVQLSRVYETEPVGGPDQQGPYLNLVARLESDLDAHELLALGQTLEEKANRVRVTRWGPRTLDVDLLWLDGVAVDEPDLTVPHPRMFERAFVLAPLEEVAPDLAPADWRERIGDRGVWVVGELAELASEP